MTPKQKIEHLVLVKAHEFAEKPLPEITETNLGEVYNEFGEDEECYGYDTLRDAMNELREGEVETNIPSEYSRHYESRSVAAKYLDGTWVGWTYWYGGGKHGEPEAIDWIEYAYDLDVVEEEKLVIIRTFTKR